MLKVICFVIYTILFQNVHCKERWGYENHEDELDPDHWYMQYKTCLGNRQSPIDIEKSDVVFDPTLRPLIFHHYDSVLPPVNLTNDGHTVRVDIPDKVRTYVTSNSLNATYKLKQFHFHWGHQDNEGSEHSIFKKKYPLELHLVHADEKVEFNDALKEPYGLLVISVLFNFGNDNVELSKLSNYFNRIADPKIRNVTALYDLNVRHLLPSNLQNYLQYAGSLTTPPCNEAVKWIILTHTPHVTHQHMAKFRTLKHVLNTGREEQIETNDRTLQGIKNRKVLLHYTFDDFNH